MAAEVDHVTPVYSHIERRQDVPFRAVTNHAGERIELRLDVTLPVGDSRHDRRAILWVHGGGFRPGNDKRQPYIVRLADEFARRGYVCFSCDYRVRESGADDYVGTVGDAVEDCRAALGWIAVQAADYGIDGARAALGGGSAGGMTAVNLCALEARDGRGGIPDLVALVNLWGSPAPAAFLTEPGVGFPPTIIVHGTADALVPYEHSVALKERLERLGVRNELVSIPGAPHTPMAHLPAFSVDIARFVASVWPRA